MPQEKYAHIYNKVQEALVGRQLYKRLDLSLDMLSRIVGTNTVYLSKAINQGTGGSLTKLVNRLRVRHVIREALANGEALEETARRLGYWSRSTFYEVFRRETSTTPHRFERRMRIAGTPEHAYTVRHCS